MAKFKRYTLKALSLIWDACLIALFIYIAVVLGGCAPADPLTQRDRAERQMLACKRADAIWISPQGRLYSGRCDWNRRVLQ